ncbi:MAG: hypothetical protein EYC70_11425 [Planctomycetota bacterium]|nr:MAG: hypothetical protein EYC70_11425 [Planctomycetota bacterium]
MFLRLSILLIVPAALGCRPATQGAHEQAAAAPADAAGAIAPAPLRHPILFVTQVPIPGDFTTIASVFGNHQAGLQACGRGGDLWIRYPDGALKNLTQSAGYGVSGFQGASSIAVRDPAVHWSGEKAVFSMVIGAPTRQYVWETYYWQLYEITRLRRDETPVITRVAGQPDAANNVNPLYGSDDRILFTSDRPRNGAAHLYPQRDEYEEAPTVTGIWSLDPAGGDLRLLNHAPSGDFEPILDSFGRVVFTQWDHLQRDQQADTDVLYGNTYGTFNWSGEEADAVALDDRTEVFPEPRPARTDLLAGTNIVGHAFNHFFPWQMHEDGSEQEVLVHLGRHELHAYFERSFDDDPNLREFIADTSGRSNGNEVFNFLHIQEDPLRPGTYYGVDAPEFYTHAAGQVVRVHAAPGANPDQMVAGYVTHRDTASYTSSPDAGHSGLYRDPLPLSSGELLAVHTAQTDLDYNLGTRGQPLSRYDFRLKLLDLSGPYAVAGAVLTPGISKSLSYWDPDVLVSYSGLLWELNPVELRPRARPARRESVLEAPELAAFQQAGVEVAAVQAWMEQHGLALIVTRNVTTRDGADRQQPFNLRVPGGVQSLGAGGRVYDVAHWQLYQADLLRGLGGTTNPSPGRRVLAQPLHDALAANPPNPGGPPGSVGVAADGSAAAFVPARRALSWQLTDPAGTPVVRERYWLSFQSGEIRACGSCHGVNTRDQAGQLPPQNVPQALVTLLQHWQALPQ